MKFSGKITEERHRKGWTQEQLAERIDVSSRTISK